MEAFRGDDLRIGSVERDDAIRVLGEHFATGRLDVEEYEDRAGQAARARVAADIRALFTDLPPPYPVGCGYPGPPIMPPATQSAAYPSAPPPPVYRPYPPHLPVPMSPKSKTVAGILQIVPGFGVGRFYSGQVGIGIAQLVLTLCFGVGAIWCLVDGILLLLNGGVDEHGRPLHG